MADVIAADTKVLEGLRVSHNALADKLEHILSAAMDQLTSKSVNDELVDERCHLIRSHRFFEGPGVRYRVDPLELALLLDLA